MELPGRDAAFTARYRVAGAPPGPWNAVIASLMRHRSVRAFLPDAVPPGTLETLVAVAQSAATSSNLQTWSVICVTDPAHRAVLARIAGNQAHIRQCPLFLVWVADLSRLERAGAAAGQSLAGLPFLESFLVAAMDATIAAQNAVVAAESLGLATVYIGALRNDVVAVAELLGLPPGAVGVVGLCVGFEETAAAREQATTQIKPRLPQSVVLHHGRYDAGQDPAARAAYDAAMLAFSSESERTAYTWTERVISRIGRISALAGRDRLRDALHRLGFPLQ